MNLARTIEDTEFLLSQLQDLLREEHSAIVRFDTGSLPRLAECKLRLVNDLTLQHVTLREQIGRHQAIDKSALSAAWSAHVEHMAALRKALVKNDALLRFARDVGQALMGSSSPTVAGYNAKGRQLMSDASLIQRRV